MVLFAGTALAATTGTPADTPINAGLQLGEVGMGALIGGGGVFHFAHQMMQTHEYAKNLTYGAGMAVGGIAIYQYPAWAPHFGLAAAALIKLIA